MIVKIKDFKLYSNKIFHNLTKHVRHVKGLSVWMKDVTPHLNSILFVDYFFE